MVIVVARDRPELFRYFDQAFAGIPDVKVILDRRIGESPAGPDGATGRRTHGDVYAELRARGFVITRIW